MIPYDLKHNGKSIMKFSIPESWEESTLRQMIQWKEQSAKGQIEFCKQLEIMTGIPETDWENCSATNVDALLLPMLEWMKEPLSEQYLMSLPVPETVTINGKAIEIPKDIDFKTFGQKITFQTEMAKYAVKDTEGGITGFELSFFPVAIGIYCYPFEKFEDKKAFEFAKECELLPLKIAFPLAAFFLRRYSVSSNGIKSSYTMSRTNKSKEQELTGSTSSGLRIPFMR